MPDSAHPDHDVALVLSGGNALGAFQAGGYQALHEAGIVPDWIVGASVGAINGALLCGSPPDARIDRLRAFWQPEAAAPGPFAGWSYLEDMRRSQAAIAALALGVPGRFVPRPLSTATWNPLRDGDGDGASLYDLRPLEATLARLIDLPLLNAGAPRFSATAVDLESGADMVFDTAAQTVGLAHVRASSALLPAFAPVEIDGRVFGDAGISANLPLDPVLVDPSDRPLLCIAIDLLPLTAPRRPIGLGDVANRVQDLIFATQSRRSIAAWQAIFAERARHRRPRSITLLHIAYADQAREVSGKAFDFSAPTAADRWRSGQQALAPVLTALAEGRLPIGEPGLTVWHLAESGGPERVEWSLDPTRFTPD